ncbi:Protein BCCIP-like [Quillaja saponaria]|uniref:Protein BCCIP-like n=1 Tax=Quillaja saponaria TaxID=32244 RepID=A0AAD7LA22_QUISA|nr:Protein BCCIP-like [Quillaja saponaria]
MPRRPKRHRQLVRAQPLTFSPFARSVARVASLNMVKRQTRGSKFERKSSSSCAGNNGFTKLTYVEKKVKEQTESSDEEFEGVVQADFAFFDPKPDDFHGVKTLLQTYLDDKQWDLSGFVDLILGQTTVGTVVKLEGDEDEGVFSLVTALNLGRYMYKNADQKKRISNDNDEAVIYIKPEDEIFHKHSSWSFKFSLQSQRLATSELKNYKLTGLVMAVEADKISTFRQELQSLINES